MWWILACLRANWTRWSWVPGVDDLVGGTLFGDLVQQAIAEHVARGDGQGDLGVGVVGQTALERLPVEQLADDQAILHLAHLAGLLQLLLHLGRQGLDGGVQHLLGDLVAVDGDQHLAARRELAGGGGGTASVSLQALPRSDRDRASAGRRRFTETPDGIRESGPDRPARPTARTWGRRRHLSSGQEADNSGQITRRPG